MDRQQLAELLEKYVNGTATPAERALLESLDNSLLAKELGSGPHPDYERVKAGMYAKLTADKTISSTPRPMRRVVLPYVAAAIVLFGLVGWWGLAKYWPEQGQQESVQTVDNDIAPGGNKATLTLAGGRKIDLSAEQAGIVVADGITYLDGSTVIEDGKWKMESEGHNDTEGASGVQRSALNSITTPKGGTYQVTLPDGSKAWLNAASTLKYPSRFGNEARVVELVGEGFFEVVHVADKPVPFRVISGNQVVEVYGTAFNISAYPDEAMIQTTLVNGSVEVKTAGSSNRKVLKPGQQAVFDGNVLYINTVDAEEYGAWRDGRFAFSGTAMDVCIKQLERWYDVDFVVNTDLDGIEMWGYLSRDVMLSEILRAATLNTPLQFKKEGRRIMVVRK